MRRRWVLRGLGFVAVALAVVAALSFVVMMLWNALVPSLFAGPLLGFWQAAGLLVLSRILLGGFRRHGWHGGWHRRMGRERWERMTPEERARFRDGYERWSQMTSQERAEFRKSFRGRCGYGGPEPEAPSEPRG